MLTDHLGTIRTLVSSAGVVLNRTSYDTFGRISEGSEPTTRYGYTGREYDEDVEMTYYRTRYYDGAVGKWVTQDTLGFAGGDANLYRYVFNAPTLFVDSSGTVPASVGDDANSAVMTFIKEEQIKGRELDSAFFQAISRFGEKQVIRAISKALRMDPSVSLARVAKELARKAGEPSFGNDPIDDILDISDSACLVQPQDVTNTLDDITRIIDLLGRELFDLPVPNSVFERQNAAKHRVLQ